MKIFQGKTDHPEQTEMRIQSLFDFIELAERKELETGEPCRVLVTY